MLHWPWCRDFLGFEAKNGFKKTIFPRIKVSEAFSSFANCAIGSPHQKTLIGSLKKRISGPKFMEKWLKKHFCTTMYLQYPIWILIIFILIRQTYFLKFQSTSYYSRGNFFSKIFREFIITMDRFSIRAFVTNGPRSVKRHPSCWKLTKIFIARSWLPLRESNETSRDSRSAGGARPRFLSKITFYKAQ